MLQNTKGVARLITILIVLILLSGLFIQASASPSNPQDIADTIGRTNLGSNVVIDGKNWTVIEKRTINQQSYAMLIIYGDSYSKTQFRADGGSATLGGNTLQAAMDSAYSQTTQMKTIAVVPNLTAEGWQGVTSNLPQTPGIGSAPTATMAGSRTNSIFFALSHHDVDRVTYPENGIAYSTLVGAKSAFWLRSHNLQTYPGSSTSTAMYASSTHYHQTTTTNSTLGLAPAVWVKYADSSQPAQATINVRHIDMNTGADLVTPASHKVNPGSYGPYPAVSISGYGQGTLAPGSAPASGTISAGQTITITYRYSRQATINVRHIDRDTLANLVTPEHHIVNPGSYGPYQAISVAGYGQGVLAPGSDPASGTISGGQVITITYQYSRQATINVRHIDRDTLANLVTPEHHIVNPGSYGPYQAISVAGYGPGVLAPGSDPASGTISGGQVITITYQYSRQATINVRHIDRDTLANLVTPEHHIVSPGSYGPYQAINVAGYGQGVLAPGSDPASGTINGGQVINITYQYVKHATIVITYKDSKTGGNLAGSPLTLTVDAGNYGPYAPVDIYGYRSGYLASGSDAPQGTIQGGETKYITYMYDLGRTVKGQVWPMLTDDIWSIGKSFIESHDVVVELRPTFLTPAHPDLSTKAVLLDSTGLGEFTFEYVPYGNYVLHIRRPGYLVRSMLVTVSENDANIITLSPPALNENGVFRLWWGDSNDDGRIDNEDVMMILELMDLSVNANHPYYYAGCDFNGDGLIDNEDIQMVLEMWNRMLLDYSGTNGVDPFN
ncbi:MAG: dockerin type I domain-containing protein [Oscillospiraceae bacterium]|nr:dockerin type I domain-containing protein [Oscillospiraceae bacterium]